MSSSSAEPQGIVKELLELNRRLLQSIAEGDWQAYTELCEPSLSAFEPEARGQLVTGMEFHKFYFDCGGIVGPHNTTMCAPYVRLLGDVAVICYVRLLQRMEEGGTAVTVRSEETRVWRRENGAWRHVHFHRSMNS